MLNIHRGDNGKNVTKPLLASRVINSLPVVRSLWGFGLGMYDTAKNSSELVRAGLEFAEGTADPFVQKYKSIDRFASNQVDKLGDLYEAGSDTVKSYVPSPSEVLHTAAYPIGYAYGLALGGMNVLEDSVEGTRLEGAVERVYDLAGSLVDGILPPTENEEENESDSILRRKNPIRRIGKRTSLQSIRAIPSNTFTYATQLTKRYSRAVATKSVDYGTVFLWNRADNSYHNIERIVNLMMRLQFTRNLLARPLPVFYEITDRYELTKRIRHDGAEFIRDSMSTILSQLDLVHALVQGELPHTAEIVEKISVGIFNFQSWMEATQSKKRSLPFDDDEERLRKRERHIEAAHNKKANAWHKVTGRSKRPISKPVVEMLKPVVESPAEETPIKTVDQALHATPNNPFATLLVESEQKEEALKAHKRKEHHEEPKEEPKESESEQAQEKEKDEAHEQAIREKAKLEMQKWAQQQHDALRLEQERKVKAEQGALRREQKLAEEEKALKEEKLQAEIKKRAQEKAAAEKLERQLQEKADEERFAKELAHLKIAQKNKEEKAAREEELRREKKRAEIEKNVRIALAQREREERKASAPERKADNNAIRLIQEVEKEKAAEKKLEEKEERKEAEKKAVAEKKAEESKAADTQQTEHKKSKKSKKANKHNNETAVFDQQGNRTDMKAFNQGKKEIAIIGGNKVVDDLTHWSVHTADDEPWQKVAPKHATHKQADSLLNPPALEDAEHQTAAAENNLYFSLNQKETTVGDNI